MNGEADMNKITVGAEIKIHTQTRNRSINEWHYAAQFFVFAKNISVTDIYMLFHNVF